MGMSDWFNLGDLPGGGTDLGVKRGGNVVVEAGETKPSLSDPPHFTSCGSDSPAQAY